MQLSLYQFSAVFDRNVFWLKKMVRTKQGNSEGFLMCYLSCIHFYGFSSVFRLYETLTNFGVYFSTSRSSRQFGLNGPIEALRCMSIAAWKGYDHEEHRQATRRGLLALKLNQDITVMSVKLCVTINFLWRHFTYSLHLFQRIFTSQKSKHAQLQLGTTVSE